MSKINLEERIGWDIDDPADMTVKIFDKVTNKTIFRISVHEIIERSSRKEVLAHVKACDATPWLKRWQEEKYNELMDILKT